MRTVFPGILIACFLLVLAPAHAALPGGGISIIFQCSDAITSTSCNANGATVFINDESRGTISNGELELTYQDGFSTYKIIRDGYYDKVGSIPEPAPGQTTDITIDATLTQKPAGSGKGWITVHCNLDGATVSFDGVTKGTTSGGVFTHEVATTATPYTSYSVSKSGYVTVTDTLSGMPSDGQTLDLYATLNPVPATTVATTVPTSIPTTSMIIGGDEGWYKITGNVNGASVYFDSAYKGAVSGGSLTVPVYSTGTPYKTYRVEKEGYVTATGSLPAAPAKGQTVTVHVPLSPVATQTMTSRPTATAAPPGSEKGYIAIHANVDGATVTVGSNPVGIITSGVLKVPVSTTGTPYAAFTVAKPGYTTTTGTVPRQPAAGETVDVYVTLTEEPVVPTTESPLSLPVIIAGILGSAALLRVRRV